MNRRVGIITLIVIVGILVLGVLATFTAPVQIIGSYTPPGDGEIDRSYTLVPGKLAVVARPDDESYNLAIFDLQSLSFSEVFNFVPEAADEQSGSGIMAIASSSLSPRIAIAYGYAEAVAVGNTSTGELELEVDFDPLGYVTAGMAGVHEVAIAFGKYSARIAVIDLDTPSYLGDIQLPEEYELNQDWESERSADYENSYHDKGQLVYSDISATAFIPFGQLGVVQWITLSLTSGFSYQMGAINVGGNPRWLTLSESGNTLYSLDDQNNVLKVIDVNTLSVVDTIDIDSGSIAQGLIESQGVVYLAYYLDSPYEFYLARINPLTHESVSSEIEEGYPTGPVFYESSLYVIRTELGTELSELLEYDGAILDLTDQVNLGAHARRLMLDRTAGYAASTECDTGELIIISL